METQVKETLIATEIQQGITESANNITLERHTFEYLSIRCIRNIPLVCSFHENKTKRITNGSIYQTYEQVYIKL